MAHRNAFPNISGAKGAYRCSYFSDEESASVQENGIDNFSTHKVPSVVTDTWPSSIFDNIDLKTRTQGKNSIVVR